MGTGTSPSLKRCEAPVKSASSIVTRREFAVLQLRFKDDLTFEEIAGRLMLSVRTVHSDLANAFHKLEMAGTFVSDIEIAYA